VSFTHTNKTRINKNVILARFFVPLAFFSLSLFLRLLNAGGWGLFSGGFVGCVMLQQPTPTNQT